MEERMVMMITAAMGVEDDKYVKECGVFKVY